MKIELAKPHLLNNPAYVKPLLETALRLISESENKEPNPYSLAQKIVAELGLPTSETAIVLNAIAPRFAAKCTSSYIEKALARLENSKSITPLAIKTPSPSVAVGVQDSFSVKDVKPKLLGLLKQYKIVTGDFLLKKLGDDLKKAHCTLRTLEDNCTLQEASWNRSGMIIAAEPGFEPTKESLVQQLLSENGHKPFNINILADRFCLPTDQTIKQLKERKFGSLFLWSPYDVWSIADISVSESRLLEIQSFVNSRNGRSILLDDAFNWVVGGVVARNLYAEIYVDSKVLAIKKAFDMAGITNYHFDKGTKSFVSNTKKEEAAPKLAPLYKPLWEDD